MVAHPTSSVYGAGAAGPAMISARDAPNVDFRDPSLLVISVPEIFVNEQF